MAFYYDHFFRKAQNGITGLCFSFVFCTALFMASLNIYHVLNRRPKAFLQIFSAVKP